MSSELLSAYINEQPEVIKRVLQGQTLAKPQGLHALLSPEGKLPPTYLLGSGSSLNAALAVKSHWLSITEALEILDPCNFLLYLEKGLVAKNGVVIGISQSGQSSITVEALEQAKGRGLDCFSVTAAEDSPITKVSSHNYLVGCGEELVGPKTKGYSATVATLICLALALQGGEFKGQTVEDIKSYLNYQDFFRELGEKYKWTDLCFVIGSGDNLGTAKEGALKIMEIAKIPTLYFDLEDSMHGPLTVLGENSLVIVLGCEKPMGNRLEGLFKILASLNAKGIYAAQGEVKKLLGEPGECKLGCDPIADVVPIQLLAYSLAIATNTHPTELSYDRTFVRSITKLG